MLPASIIRAIKYKMKIHNYGRAGECLLSARLTKHFLRDLKGTELPDHWDSQLRIRKATLMLDK
jgi:hypothetical protein